MKNTSLPAQLPALTDDSVYVENLRNASGSLVPVTDAPPPDDVVAEYRHRDGSRSVITLDGRRLAVTRSGTPVLTAILPGDYRCAAVTAGEVVVMTSAGPWRLRFDASGEPVAPVAAADYSGVEIVRSSTAHFSSGIPAFAFSQSYRCRRPVALADTDLRAFTRHLSAARGRAAASAAASGYYVQPLLVWYHVTDSAGGLLFRSSPVVISPPEGVAPMSVTMNPVVADGTYTGMAVSSLRLTGFALGISAPGHIPGADAASLEVYVAPLHEVLDVVSPATVGFGDAAEDDAPFTVTLPVRADFGSTLMAMLDRRAMVGRCVARFTSPFAGGISDIPGRVVAMPDVAVTHAGDLSTALMRSPEELSMPLHECRPPHGFIADAAAVTGDMVTWAGITPLRAMPEMHFAYTLPGVAWASVTRVTLRDASGGEETVTATRSASGGAPVSLSPLVGYPHPRAVAMEISVSYADGTVVGGRFPLSPTPAGLMSVYRSTDLTPLPLAAMETALPPVSSGAPPGYPGVVLSAPASTPLCPVSSVHVTHAPVVAVTPASRSSSAWDFARRHLYVFAADGIYALAVNRTMSLSSVHLIDSRGVASARSVASSPAGVYAVAGDDLVVVTGARATTLKSRAGVSALVYRAPLSELWCRLDDVLWMVIDRDRRVFHRRQDAPVLYRAMLTSRRFIPGMPVHAAWLLAGVTGGLDLAISAGNTPSASVLPVVSAHVAGDIAAPLRMPVLCPPCRSLLVTLSGQVSAGFSFNGLLLL